MTNDIDILRFSYETRVLNEIRSRLGSIPLIDYNQSRQLLETRKRNLLGDAARITHDLLPEVHEIYKSCLNSLGGCLSGDLFVRQSNEYNANVFAHEDRFDILINSALLNDFSPGELKFVFGHELGHVIFQHTLFPVHDIIMQIKDIDPPAVHVLMRWSRASEISADRAGMLCCKELGAAATALFKTSSGLSGIDINRVLRSFRKQYDELEIQIKSLDNAPPWVSTHPMIPIRFKALELATLDIIAFAKKSAGFSSKGFRRIDGQISQILEKIDMKISASPFIY